MTGRSGVQQVYDDYEAGERVSETPKSVPFHPRRKSWAGGNPERMALTEATKPPSLLTDETARPSLVST